MWKSIFFFGKASRNINHKHVHRIKFSPLYIHIHIHNYTRVVSNYITAIHDIGILTSLPKNTVNMPTTHSIAHIRTLSIVCHVMSPHLVSICCSRCPTLRVFTVLIAQSWVSHVHYFTIMGITCTLLHNCITCTLLHNYGYHMYTTLQLWVSHVHYFTIMGITCTLLHNHGYHMYTTSQLYHPYYGPSSTLH